MQPNLPPLNAQNFMYSNRAPQLDHRTQILLN